MNQEKDIDRKKRGGVVGTYPLHKGWKSRRQEKAGQSTRTWRSRDGNLPTSKEKKEIRRRKEEGTFLFNISHTITLFTF